jgi:hypothetical protein
MGIIGVFGHEIGGEREGVEEIKIILYHSVRKPYKCQLFECQGKWSVEISLIVSLNVEQNHYRAL